MKTTIISVGGGGYNVANGVRKSGLFAGASLLSCDTDKTALNKETEHADKRFLFERDRVNPNDVKALLEQADDTIILCATIGGLTGSAYAPMIAHEARQAGKFVCSLFTMPFSFEGEKRNSTASTAQKELLVASNFAIQQNNDHLRAVLNGRCSMHDFMEKADQGLIDVLKSVLSSRALEDWAMEQEQEKLQALIPEQYRLSGEPYIELYANGHSVLAR